MLLGIGVKGGGLTRPWGAEINGIEVVDVWGFAGGILNGELFGEEAGGGIPK